MLPKTTAREENEAAAVNSNPWESSSLGPELKGMDGEVRPMTVGSRFHLLPVKVDTAVYCMRYFTTLDHNPIAFNVALMILHT